jgi:DnaJ-class molecular chaperone
MSQHHTVLGVAVTATQAEIRIAYKRAALLHHPDRDGGTIEKFIQIQNAYKALTKQKCETCSGTGFIKKKQGVFIMKIQCPICWKIT